MADFFEEAAPEPFFVRTSSGSKGDERDAIIPSASYGKTRTVGAAQFWSAQSRGRERQLNVAITRPAVTRPSCRLVAEDWIRRA